MSIAVYDRMGSAEQLGVGSYENAQQIEELQKELYKISPELKLNIFSLNGNKAITAGFSIPEKGNKVIIDKLLSMGFRKMGRTKKAERYWDMFSSYGFVVRLEKSL